jgi:hypothetical protein
MDQISKENTWQAALIGTALTPSPLDVVEEAEATVGNECLT